MSHGTVLLYGREGSLTTVVLILPGTSLAHKILIRLSNLYKNSRIIRKKISKKLMFYKYCQ